MQRWVERRSASLLRDINDVPFSDDHDELALGLIRQALRDAAGELLARAARSARDALAESEARQAGRDGHPGSDEG